MKQFSYVLTHEPVHKPISHLFREAAKFESRIQLAQGGTTAALTSRDLAELHMQCGSHVMVTVEGKDEEAAVAAIQNYFVANM